MSRIGKHSISIPQGVNVTVDANNIVTVTGPKGTLSRDVHKDIKVVVENNEITVVNEADKKELSKFQGLARQLINNMVVGVTQGFERRLTINGVGYRITQKGQDLVLNVGYSHPVEMEDPEGLESVVDGSGLKITIKGIDKEKVGQYAANIREKRAPEPYKGKGIKYADEVIRRKVGKTGKK